MWTEEDASKQEHTLLQDIMEGFAERQGVDLKQAEEV